MCGVIGKKLIWFVSSKMVNIGKIDPVKVFFWFSSASRDYYFFFNFFPLGKQLSSFACPGHFPACPGFETPTWIPKRKSFPGVLECSKSVWLVCSLLSVKYFACYFMNYMLIIFSWFFILKPLNQCFQLSKPLRSCSMPWTLNCILPEWAQLQKIILKRRKRN